MNRFLKGFCIFASVFTLITIFSSLLQLVQGTQTDTNIHILVRAVITFIPIFMYFVLDLKKKCRLAQFVLKVAIHYIFSLGAAFLTVFLLGFQYTLSKNAYRDIFINFSGAYLIVAAAFIIVLTHHTKKHKSNGD